MINGTFYGESPPVSSLPVLPVIPGPLHTRDNESLQSGGSTGARDPVVQHGKGTGPISAPIAELRRDLPAVRAAVRRSRATAAACRPTPTARQVATQYVEMVNTDFAVYSKTGAVLRTSTPINQLWANTNGECKIAQRRRPGRRLRPARETLGADRSSSRRRPTRRRPVRRVHRGLDVERRDGRVLPLRVRLRPRRLLRLPAPRRLAGRLLHDRRTSSRRARDVLEGAAVFAFERSQDARAASRPVSSSSTRRQHNPTGGQYIGLLPGDLDGHVASRPPARRTCSLRSTTQRDPAARRRRHRLRPAHVEVPRRLVEPGATRRSGTTAQPNSTLPVAPFVRPQCVYGYGDCVPQKGGPQHARRARRPADVPACRTGSSATTTSLLAQPHGADARRATTGVRWYEVRLPTSGPPSSTSRGRTRPTTPPTRSGAGWAASRWTSDGDIALGFSASGPERLPVRSLHRPRRPAIRSVR